MTRGVPLQEQRLRRAWMIVLRAHRATHAPAPDVRMAGYAAGRADGARATYAAAAGLSDQAVRDRLRAELGY